MEKSEILEKLQEIFCDVFDNDDIELTVDPVAEDIEEWITNSFHGTVFSLQYHKKNGILPLVGEYAKMNSRITTLLNKYKIFNHFLYDKDLTFIEKAIDYNYFELTKEEEFLKFSSDIDFVLK